MAVDMFVREIVCLTGADGRASPVPVLPYFPPTEIDRWANSAF